MDAAGQQFLNTWYGHLQQTCGQVQQLMQETDAGCRQMLQGNTADPMPLMNAIRAVDLRIKDIRVKLGETWTREMLSRLMGSLDNRETIRLGEERWSQSEQWIEESWERFKTGWIMGGLRAMYQHVQTAMTKPIGCQRCGNPLSLEVRHQSSSVTCRACNTVNQVQPEPVVYTYFSLAPDAWAESSTIDKRLAIAKFRREVEMQAKAHQATMGERSQESVDSLKRWEQMERDYWQSYFAAKAQILPQSAEDQAKMVESRMKPFLDDLGRNPAWREAQGMKKAVEVAVIPRELADVDEWGPLRPDQLEEFEFHQFLLEESRQDPDQFHAYLARFGYRDVVQWERVRRTFRKHMNAADPRLMQIQLNARNRASQEQMKAKQAAAGDILAPFEGVSLEQYASLTAKQASGMAQQQFLQILAQNGMDYPKWERVSNEWMARMSRDTSGVISNAYAQAFTGAGQGQYGASGQAGAAAMGQYGVPQQAPAAAAQQMTFEQYCEIMGAQAAWAKTGKDVNAMLKQVFNMTAMDWGNVSAYWMTKLTTDMNLAMRMTPLMQQAEAKYS